MSKKLHGFIAIWLIVATILLALPKTAFADGGEGVSEQEVNGYHIALNFVEKAKVGENQFHIQITDAMGMPVTNAEVEVSAMPLEGMEMETEAPSVGVMTSNNSMDSMEMATEAPATGVMKPNAPAADGHGEENVTVMLEPTTESGEYAGEVHVEKSGEWMFSVHFTVNGETTEVDFPINVTRALRTNYAVLGGFFGINATVLAAAAVLKRKSPVIRK
ncbi:MAG: FixH family protein [Chloroflexi bacterium]|nr:FixH family protein [Chloroflexota bacterium]